MSPSTAFVTLTDAAYFSRAKRTIEDLRIRGQWVGPIVLVAVGFYPSTNWLDFHGVHCRTVEPISVEGLKAAWTIHPIRPMADERHTKKLAQWNKLHLFDVWWRQWDRIIYLDAGMRVVGPVAPLLDIHYSGSLVAPDDSQPADNGNRLRCQFDWSANPAVSRKLIADFGESAFDSKYFINCMWICDTAAIIKPNTVEDLVAAMNKYPVSLTNEMGIMNLYFAESWRPLPEKSAENKYIYGWCELNYPAERPTWRDFCLLKYPVTINMDCN
jgi:hypothetical protein